MIALDVETAPVIPGLLAPPLACLSWYDGKQSGLQSLASIQAVVNDVLANDDMIIGHNFGYDAVVLSAAFPELLSKFFGAYQAGQIVDTMLNEQLFDIARGELGRQKYSLAALAAKYLGRELDKDTWRLGYGRLIGTPIKQWPVGAVEYAKDDPKATYGVYKAQQKLNAAEDPSWLVNATVQAKYAFSQQLMCVWGIRTDPDRVALLAIDLERQRAAHAEVLRGAGVLRDDGTKDLSRIRELVAEAYNGDPPLTPAGAVACDRVTVEAVDDPVLQAYAKYVGLEKLLGTYVPVLLEGTKHPINASFRLLETGRRGANKNMQTPPKAEGVRECYVPRPGFVYCSCDYDSLEFRHLGQANVDLFGSSPIADMYRADPNADPHVKFAAENFLHITYDEGMRRKAAGDEVMIRLRQAAKAYNFGLPGGLGATRFVDFAKNTYGLELTLAEAESGKAKWLKAWRLQPFFDYVNRRVRAGYIEHFRSGRVRGGIGFCDGANALFQSPAADGACEAHFQVSWSCYAKPESPLYGSRIVNFLHDELLLEVPEDRATEAARELARVMVEAMRVYAPDVPITATPTLMTHWSKKAKSKTLADGRLEIWGAAA